MLEQSLRVKSCNETIETDIHRENVNSSNNQVNRTRILSLIPLPLPTTHHRFDVFPSVISLNLLSAIKMTFFNLM